MPCKWKKENGMSRSKQDHSIVESEVARLVTKIVNNSGKSQLTIAKEAGYARSPNTLTMIKRGTTKLSIEKVIPLAYACESDPKQLMNSVLREYFPAILQGLGDISGTVIDEDEMLIVDLYRREKAAKTKSARVHRAKLAKTATDRAASRTIQASLSREPASLNRLKAALNEALST
jgi:transcriptional regulator with XRE-family HTH domain